MRIVLIGASGFFGEYLLRALTGDRHQCVVLTRNLARRKNLALMPAVRLVQADVHDAETLVEHFADADAVVSMAGILNETGSSGNGFEKVHVDLVRNIIGACEKTGVTRLLHISALHAGGGESLYLKTKGKAEELLKSSKNLHVTIFQPSVIFGEGDEFFNRFAGILQLAPVLPLAMPKSRLQPVFAGDVAACMLASLDDPMTWGKTYKLVGPKSYTLKELVQFTADTLGKRRRIIGLPTPVSALMAKVMNLVPGKPFSWDNYLSLKTDNTSDESGFRYFGIEPRSIEIEVPYYLAGSPHQRRLGSFRRQNHS
jgi:NADH dehydrogenase